LRTFSAIIRSHFSPAITSSLNTTNVFVEGIRQATSRKRFQVTTDGFAPYRTAIPDTLGDRCDFAMLIKVYRPSQEGEAKYSPLKFNPSRSSQSWVNLTPNASALR